MGPTAAAGSAARPARRVAHGGIALLAACAAAVATGQTAPASGPQTYSCTVNGKKLVSDRPIPECNGIAQNVLNSDGSVRKVLAPPPTDDERERIEAQQRDAIVERTRQQEAVRRDRNLLARFPNEAAHNKARQAALEDVRKSVHLSESRLAALAVERKPLMEEAEFYVGKPQPIKLKTQLDANDASGEALRDLLKNQQLEVVRIDRLYDAELDRLKKLWSGERPGSMGVLAGAAASEPQRK